MNKLANTTKDRLIEFLEYLRLGQNAFEKKVGIANGYIAHLKKSIGSDILNRIQDAYPELNMDWLLKGEGEMLNVRVNSSVANGRNSIAVAGQGNTVNMPVSDLIKEYQEIIVKKDEQIDRLIGIIENK
ncbi:MAG: hypothetical protein LBQ31_03490 [Bacteroidales bacterium]|jgi:hypothetical protein|nr:hypothetical protein [Bacteroidales bacterium]